jgi:hypothetical protein
MLLYISGSCLCRRNKRLTEAYAAVVGWNEMV